MQANEQIIEKAIDLIIQIEGGNLPNGGYTNDPTDNGNETKYGVTKAVWRENGYTGSIIDAPLSLARTIYRKRYIEEPRFDKIMALSARVGMELIDTGVNMGPAVAAIFFQRWMNALNLPNSGYEDLFVDGRIGKLSLEAFERFLKKRGSEGAEVLLRALNGVQANRYLEISEKNKSQRRFVYGWIKERVVM